MKHDYQEKKKFRNFLKSPLFLFTILALLSFSFLIYQHERAHGQIFEYFGCEKVSYGLNIKNAFARCEIRTAEPTWEEALAHSFNESIGYPMTALFMLIMAATTCLLLQPGKKGDEDGKR